MGVMHQMAITSTILLSNVLGLHQVRKVVARQWDYIVSEREQAKGLHCGVNVSKLWLDEGITLWVNVSKLTVWGET